MKRAISTFLPILALALAGCGGGDDDKLAPPSDSSSAPPSAQQQAPTTPSQKPAARTPGGCRAVQAPQPRQPSREKKPGSGLAASQRPSLVVKTNCGSFTVALDPRTAPNAAASLVGLARAGYFDNTIFHRIVPGYIIQGGDPTQSGNGGPGYKTVDPPPKSARYTRGVVAMAKTPAERAGTAGSQFFVVTAKDSRLPPDYALVGRVTKGLRVVEKIGRLGNRNQQPTEPVVISSVKVVGG